MQFGIKKSPTINFIHGWGMSPRFWHKLQGELDAFQSTTTDLNFTSEPANKNPTSPSADFLITHSLGGLWALKNGIYPRRGMVFINSFHNFTTFSDKHILQAMQKALQDNPHAQMQRFLKQADCESQAHKTDFWNTQRLHEGLDWLQRWDGQIELASLNCPVLVLTGDKDRICKIDKMMPHWNGHTLITHPDAGHALPLSHPQWCKKQIKAWIKDNNL